MYQVGAKAMHLTQNQKQNEDCSLVPTQIISIIIITVNTVYVHKVTRVCISNVGQPDATC